MVGFDILLTNAVCILIQTDKINIIFNAGSEIYKLDIKNKNLIYLFLSHLHLSHITGLHLLAKFNFPQGIIIFVLSQPKVVIFITECFCPSTKKLTDRPRLNLKTAAKVAERFSVKKLSFTHFDAYLYLTKKQRKMAEKWAKEIFPYSYAGCGDMVSKM